MAGIHWLSQRCRGCFCHLTDAENCNETPLNRPQPAPAVRINANNTTGRQLAMPHLLMLPLFGEGVHFAELFFDDPKQQSKQLAYGYTIPISTSYYISRDGRTAATGNPSRRQFGVISMPNNTLGAYDMECGLDMVGLSKWLLERLSQLGKGGGARLWFDDIYAQGQRGVTAATFTFSKNESSEVEVLSFGASSMDLKTVSTPKQLVRSSNSSDASVTTSFSIASENAVSAICLGRDGQVGTTDMLRKRLDHTPPRSTLRLNALFPTTQLCDIMFKDPILRNVTIAIRDLPKSTQICRTLVRRYDNITANTDISDFRHYISARYSYLLERSLTVTCMQSRTRPTLPLAMFSGRWGFISALTLQSSTIQTPVNNYGPQAWFASLVLVPWWLLLVVLAAGLILVYTGGWGDLAEIVATILYSFAFRRVPPAIAQRFHEEQQEPLQTYSALPSIALENIALNQHAQFALVQRQGCRQDGYHVGQEIIEGPLEISIVPNKWRVCKDDDISPTDTSKETVVEVAHSFSRLLSVARARQAANHGNAQV